VVQALHHPPPSGHRVWQIEAHQSLLRSQPFRECKRLGLVPALYAENSHPSGYAGGKVPGGPVKEFFQLCFLIDERDLFVILVLS
jgi:hypothetical protein